MSDIVVGLVEDDPVQAELFSAIIESGGMRARLFASASEFRRRNGAESVDVLLLDWNMPGVSGIDLLQSIRAKVADYLPIILLTSNSDERDIVFGLQCGADDYIVKPPRSSEFLARIRAAHRRGSRLEMRTFANTDPYVFDFLERELRISGELVSITEREFDLLAYLFQRPGKIVSRQMLLTDVWQLGPDGNTRSIDTYVSKLRKSLGLNGQKGWQIEGVYQHGYRLVKSNA